MIHGTYILNGQPYDFQWADGRLTAPEDLRLWVRRLINDRVLIQGPEPSNPVQAGLSGAYEAYLTVNAALFDNADAFTIQWPEVDDVPADVHY